MGIITEKEYEVHYYEANYKLDCKISSIINNIKKYKII